MTRTTIAALAAALALALTGCTEGSQDANVGESVAVPTVTSEPVPAETAEPEPEPEDPFGEIAVDKQAAFDAVKIKVCRIDPDWGIQIEGTIKNVTKQVADAAIVFEVTDTKGDRIDESYTMIESLKPGQSAEWSASGLETEYEVDKAQCAVREVGFTEPMS